MSGSPPKRKWPPEACAHPKCELGRRTLRLLATGDAEQTINLQGEVTGETYAIENVRIQRWSSGRVDVHGFSVLNDNKVEILLISFLQSHGMLDGTDDEELLKRTNEALQRHMVLDELADIRS